MYSRHDVNRIEVKVGDEFNPNLHDAAFHLPVGSIPDIDAGQVGVIQEVGWTIHDRVLRPAKVGVIQ